MRFYRVYRVDGAGRFEAAEWLEAESDEQALEAARALNGGPAFELWERGRLVSASSGIKRTVA